MPLAPVIATTWCCPVVNVALTSATVRQAEFCPPTNMQPQTEVDNSPTEVVILSAGPYVDQ